MRDDFLASLEAVAVGGSVANGEDVSPLQVRVTSVLKMSEEELKAETSKFKEAFTPGPWKRKRQGDDDANVGEWMKWGKEQRRITSEGRNLIRQEGEKVAPLLGDLVLTLEDGMQHLRRILPDQMRRGVASVADI